jgi:hypothetical protein
VVVSFPDCWMNAAAAKAPDPAEASTEFSTARRRDWRARSGIRDRRRWFSPRLYWAPVPDLNEYAINPDPFSPSAGSPGERCRWRWG